MAGNDITSLIHDIFEKYTMSQKDKKSEERVYMKEEAFIKKLTAMVNESTIEDKKLLYNEIYNNLSNNSLDIDSTGNITISPKVIKLVETTINKRKEEASPKNNDDKNEKDTLKDILNKEEYDKLSEEEKKERFVKAIEWIFGSKEKAEEVYENMEAVTIKDDDLTEEIDKTKKGESLDEETYHDKLGDDETYVENAEVQNIALSTQGMINNFFMDEKAKVFLISNGDGKSNKINIALIEKLANIVDDTNLTASEIESRLDALIVKGYLDESKKDQILELAQDKDQFVAYVKMMNLLGKMTKGRKDLFKGAQQGEYDFNTCVEVFCEQFGQGDKQHVIDSLRTILGRFSEYKTIPSDFFAEIDNIEEIIDFKNEHILEFGRREKQEHYDEVASSLSIDDVFVDIGESGEQTLNTDLIILFYLFARGDYRNPENLQTFVDMVKDTGIVDETKIKAIIDIIMNQERLAEELNRIETLIDSNEINIILNDKSFFNKFSEYDKLKMEIPGIGGVKYDSFGNPDVLTNYSNFKKYKNFSDLETDGIITGGTEKKKKTIEIDNGDTQTRVDYAIDPSSVGEFSIETANEEFESNLDKSISDGEPDMFASMFDGLVEEIVFDASVLKPQITEETIYEVSEDSGIGETTTINNTGSDIDNKKTQIVAEEIVTDIGVKNEESDISDNNINKDLPKVRTFSDMIRKSVEDVKNGVKSIFNRIVSAIKGKNSNNSNNTSNTSSTSSNGGQNKEEKSVQSNDKFIPKATLSFDFMKNNEENNLTEEIRGDDGKSTDEPTIE